jgi:hypothetical protein
MSKVDLSWNSKSPFHQFAKNYAHRNLWRVKHLFSEYEDYFSELTVLFCECVHRYGEAVETPQHFMALYKRMVVTRTINMTQKAADAIDFCIDLPLDINIENEEEASVMPCEAGNEELTILITQGSQELRSVLSIILDTPAEMTEALKDESKGGIQGLNRFFAKAAKLAGFGPHKAMSLQGELFSLLGA